MLQRIKRMTSHAGYARYLAECEDTPFSIPKQTDIPSPSYFGQSHTVFTYNNRHVIIVETMHKRYDVFAVPSTLLQPRDDIAQETAL